jgi:hypothetical protein
MAGLIDTETAVEGVTTGTVRAELRAIGNVVRVGGGALNEGPDLGLTVGWGHPSTGGATMPGQGRIAERAFSPAELDAMGLGAERLGIAVEQMIKQLGGSTLDVYLNEVAYWKNIPVRVWSYSIGGYQVIKKWLSYREKDMLHRSLSSEETREVMNMGRRIAAILLLEPALDANYETVKRSCYSWPAQKVAGPEGLKGSYQS